MQSRKVHSGAMTEGVIWKQLLLFFFPILLGTFFQQLYNTVDAMIVGKAVGKEALAAVGGATGNLINLLVGFFVGISSGATVIISQYYGARRDEDVSRAVHTAAAVALLFGAGLTGIGLILSPALLSMMRTPETVLPHATAYLRIYFLGMIPQMIYNMGSGILRAIGDSRRPLFFLVAACMTNILPDRGGCAGRGDADALACKLPPDAAKDPPARDHARQDCAHRASGGSAERHVFREQCPDSDLDQRV